MRLKRFRVDAAVEQKRLAVKYGGCIAPQLKALCLSSFCFLPVFGRDGIFRNADPVESRAVEHHV